MRLIWLGARTPARTIARAIASTTIVAAAIACGTGDDPSGATEGTSGGMPTSTETPTTMSAGQTTAPTSHTAGSSSDSGEPTDDTATSAPTDTGTGSSGPSSTEGSGSSGSGSGGDSSSTGEPATDTGTESTTGGIMSQACADGCEVEFTCGIRWKSAEACTEWCNANLGFAADFSPFCMQAWEELSVCLGTLDCTQYMQWQAPVEFPYPCYQEDDALAFECDGQ